MIRRSALTAGALLGAFHLWLLGRQAVSGQLSDPETVLGWLVALLLVGGLVTLRRRGESLRGRRAVAVWVLAALLHGPAMASSVDDVAPALPQAVVSVTQVAATAALGVVLLLCLRATTWTPAAAAVVLVAVDRRVAAAATPATGFRFLPRPPPLA